MKLSTSAITLLIVMCVVGASTLQSQGHFQGGTGCRKDHVFDEVIVSVLPVETRIECASSCLLYPLCLSFNYCEETTGTTCELSTEPTDGTCDQLVPRANCYYYEKTV